MNQGEIFGFLGPNGAGKTTTVKLLCGMLTPSGGKCQVLGIDPVQNPEQLHKKVGVVTEHAQMYDHMTALENSPLSLGQLFQSKILAGFSVGMMVSYSSFAAMLLVMELEFFFLTGNLLLPAASWLAIMLLIAPAVSLVAIAVTVRSSAKAQTIEEAQQRAVFLIFPILALLIGQFTGIILISAGLLWGVGIVLAALAILLVKRAAGNFTYEKLLK